MLGGTKWQLIFVVREGFRRGPLVDVFGSLQLPNSTHVRKREKALLKSVMVGGVWNDFLLGRVRGQLVPCRENHEFHHLMRMDEGHWPRCLLWHGWIPLLSGVDGASPWAADASECAVHLVEVALGRCSPGLMTEWSPPHGFLMLLRLLSDGSLVLDHVTGASSSGAGFFAHQSEDCWRERRWGHVDDVRPHGEVQSCRVFVLFLGLFSQFRG